MQFHIRIFIILCVFCLVSCGTTEKPIDNKEKEFTTQGDSEITDPPHQKADFELKKLTEIEVPFAENQIIKSEAKLKDEGGKKIALLIFAEEYSNEYYNIDIAKSGNLLENLQISLRENLDFNEVISLSGKDVTESAIKHKFKQISDNLLPQDTVLIYYYGHGFTSKNEIFFFQYWTEFENNNWSDTLSRKFFHKLSYSLKEHTPESKIILIFDACKPAMDLAPPAPVVTKESLADAEISSCSNGQFAKVNIFTPSFCDTIRENDDRLTLSLSEVFTQTTSKVLKITNEKQMPEFLGSNSIMLRTGKGFKVSFTMHNAKFPDRKLQSNDSEIKLNSRSMSAPCVFEGVNEGDYVISAKYDGYLWRTEIRSLGDSDKYKNFDIPLLPEFIIIRGTLDYKELKGVQPSEVSVEFQGKKLKGIEGYHIIECKANSEGYFELRIPLLPTEPVLNFSIVRSGKKVTIGKTQLNILRKYHAPITNVHQNVQYQPVEVYDIPKFPLKYEVERDFSIAQTETVGDIKIPKLQLVNPSSKISYESFVDALKAVINKKTSDEKFFRNTKLSNIHLKAIMESEENPETDMKLKAIAQQIFLFECFRFYTSNHEKGILHLMQYIGDGNFDGDYLYKAKRQLSIWFNSEGFLLSKPEKFDRAKNYFLSAMYYAVKEDEKSIFKQNLHDLYVLKIHTLMDKALQDDTFADVKTLLDEAIINVSPTKEIQEFNEFLKREKQHPILKRAYEEGASHYRQGNFEVAELILADIADSLNPYYSKFAHEYLATLKSELYKMYYKQGLNNLNNENPDDAFLYLLYAYINANDNERKVCDVYFSEYFKHPDFTKIFDENESISDLSTFYESINNIFLKQKLINRIDPSAGNQVNKCEYMTDHEQKYYQIAKNGSIIECSKFLTKFPDRKYSDEIFKLKKQMENEDEAYTKAKNGTSVDCEKFLSKYPDSENASEIQKLRKQREEEVEQQQLIKENQRIFDEIMCGNYSNHEKLKDITPEVARELAKYEYSLSLNGLSSITEEVAHELALHSNELSLNGLCSLTVEVAHELAKHNSRLYLNGLSSITEEVARELAKHKNWLYLDGLTSITEEVARELAKHNSTIWAQSHIEEEIAKFK